ncbi:MAG TPA: hypothetical protein VG708_10120 [Mycobacteriales bacterium]|nr:hypothetical protein [Mycobacteriales bacterium]
MKSNLVGIAAAVAMSVTVAMAPAVASAASPAASSAAAAAPAAASHHHHTKVIASCTKAVYKPANYVLACADANILVRHVKYKSWTHTKARGTGTYSYNTCKPDCADGHFRHFHARFVLDQVKKVHGRQLFTEIRLHYRGHEVTYALPTKPI